MPNTIINNFNFDFNKNCERYIIDLIEQAIIQEDKSIKYYKNISELTSSSYNKSVIREIFLDKSKHKDMLIYLYEKLIDNHIDLTWKFEYPLIEHDIINNKDCYNKDYYNKDKDKHKDKDKNKDKNKDKHKHKKYYTHNSEDDFLEQVDISFKNELDNANFYRIIMTMFNELDIRDLILECIIDNQKHAQMLNYMYLKNII